MSRSNPKILLFVYGTLMSDGCRNHILNSEKFLGEVTTLPSYDLLDLKSFPGLVTGEREIKGELYEISEGLLPLLDKIEGSPWLYKINDVKIRGESRPVFAYFYQQRNPRSIIYPKNKWANKQNVTNPKSY